MFGAGAAGADDLFLQSLSGAVDADGGVIGGDAGLGGEGVEGAVVEIDEFESLAVFGFEIVEQVEEALADGVAGVGVGGIGLQRIVREGFVAAITGGLLAVVIDDGVTEDAIEPGDDILLFGKFVAVFDGANEGGLEDVFGNGAGFDTRLQESQEAAMAVDEGLESRLWLHTATLTRVSIFVGWKV